MGILGLKYDPEDITDAARRAFMAANTSQTSTGPLLGSAYLTSNSLIPPQSPSDLSPSLCLNISLFKQTLKRYRALDDAIVVRLNRDSALHRGDAGGPLDVHDEPHRKTCLRIWKDVIESWQRREAVIRHCVSTIDDRLDTKAQALQSTSEAAPSRTRTSQRDDFSRLDANRPEEKADDMGRVQLREGMWAEEVKRQQLHNELSVESIIRRRTLTAFFSRCPDFQPPSNADGSPPIPTVDLAPMPMRHRPVNN